MNKLIISLLALTLVTSSASALALPGHAERGLYARDTYDDIEARGFKSSVLKIFGKKKDGETGSQKNNIPNANHPVEKRGVGAVVRNIGRQIQKRLKGGPSDDTLETSWRHGGGFHRRDFEPLGREYNDFLVERAYDDLD